MKTIPLGRGYHATVDDKDYVRLSAFTWRASIRRRKNGQIIRIYAVRWTLGSATDRKMLYMHREVMRLTDATTQADHRDHDGLNNRRRNLRVCSNQQNVRHQKIHRNNSSGRKGVSWHSIGNKWRAAITFNKKSRYLGLFDSLKDASAAYDTAAKQHFGEFALTNEAA